MFLIKFNQNKCFSFLLNKYFKHLTLPFNEGILERKIWAYNVLLLHVCMHANSHVLLFEILWTVAHQSPLYMKFYRQEHRSGLPSPPPGDLTNPRNKPPSPALQVNTLPLNQQGSPINLSLSLNPSINLSIHLILLVLLLWRIFTNPVV